MILQVFPKVCGDRKPPLDACHPHDTYASTQLLPLGARYLTLNGNDALFFIAGNEFIMRQKR